jgi:hypothetical protein
MVAEKADSRIDCVVQLSLERIHVFDDNKCVERNLLVINQQEAFNIILRTSMVAINPYPSVNTRTLESFDST